jgi:hypothetical protein
MRHALLGLVLLGALPGCPRTPPPVEKSTSKLPDTLARYQVGPLVEGAGWTRRSYRKGAVAIDVTLAERAIGPDEWEGWRRSCADYPAAPFPLPTDEAAGFYTCSGTGDAERCDSHFQLRAGFHLEFNANGTATRADLDELSRALPPIAR